VASQTIALALIRQLCRAGALDAAEIEAIAAALEADGAPDDAHLVRCEMLNAVAPTQSEWEAEQRRGRMRIVPPDGGN
jgi:hypothetical protein